VISEVAGSVAQAKWTPVLGPATRLEREPFCRARRADHDEENKAEVYSALKLRIVSETPRVQARAANLTQRCAVHLSQTYAWHKQLLEQATRGRRWRARRHGCGHDASFG